MKISCLLMVFALTMGSSVILAKEPIESKNVVKSLKGAKIFKDYCTQLKKNTKYVEAFKNKKLTYDQASMRFDYSIKGKPGENGYPLYIALHGGGATRANESQWNHMKVYYRDSVDNGIYVATRGVRDTWNTHFNAESYALYDLLIELMIAFENADPNRVYILGFSAGGDGTYNLAPSMADRWAGAAMSAGHHNGISPKNLLNVPMLLQVGEFDTAFNRHAEAAKYNQQLDELQKANGGYIHDCFIHLNRGHNFLDNHPQMIKQDVIASPTKWLQNQDRTTKKINTNSIAWLNQYQRNPYPEHLIWNLETKGERRDGAEANGENLFLSGTRPFQFYWLSVGFNDANSLGCKEVEARLDRKSNQITILKAKTFIKVLLNEKMVDFSKPLQIKIDDQEFVIRLKADSEVMKRTLAERGDPNYMFSAEVTLKEKDGKWSIDQ